MTKYKEWPDHAVDLICAGCPCQSFSVAGLRKGLDDPRGNLTLTYLAILDKYRPRWMVYENVPGILSDKTGAFGAFLGGLAELGYGFAYRILDAQFVRVESHPGAVPQRRRRLFVVGYLGDWRPAAAVLFEQESLCGHPAPSREAGKRTASSLVRGSQNSGGIGYDNQALFSQRGDNLIRSTDIPEVSPTVQQGPPFSRTGNDRVECEAIIPCWPATVAPTLNTHFGDKQGLEDQHALNGGGLFVHGQAVAFTQNQAGDVLTGQVMHNLGTNSNATGRNAANVQTKTQVRRLTPTECERLQGFPDNHTAIIYKGKPAADGARYKALGNSMAVNVMSWIGQRIQMCDEVLRLTNERNEG